MKYLTLLRGINVGGNSLVKMANLKTAFINAGFTDVSTFINSGNVLFSSEEKATEKITRDIEDILAKTFFSIKVIVISKNKLAEIIKKIPQQWHNDKDLRCYIAFIKPPVTPQEVLPEIETKEGVDFIDIGPGVVYMSTKLEGLTKSTFTKLIGKKIYKDMTMRNYTTVKKLSALMTI